MNLYVHSICLVIITGDWVTVNLLKSSTSFTGTLQNSAMTSTGLPKIFLKFPEISILTAVVSDIPIIISPTVTVQFVLVTGKVLVYLIFCYNYFTSFSHSNPLIQFQLLFKTFLLIIYEYLIRICHLAGSGF